MGKRDRVIRGGWRHGITGVIDVSVDDPSATSSLFYKSVLERKAGDQNEREAINRRRQKSKNFQPQFVSELALGVQTTTLINFGVSDELKRSFSLHKNPE